jgi:GNAT superfamily N-acetyltransferase
MLLTDAEGWHRSVADWERLLRLEPDGVFKAVADGIPAGTAATMTFARIAWIHSVIVIQELRGRGIGEALMRACLEFVDRKGIPCTKLDSEEGVEPFYARLGFREEYPSWRLLAEGRTDRPKLERLRPADHEDVFAFDRSTTGLDRRRALTAILVDYPDRSFLVRGRGRIRGYVITRSGERRDPIGPCVADPEDPGLAEDLLRAALASDPARTYRMCVGGYHRAALTVAADLGFTRESHSTRMCRGSAFEESRGCYAMISAEKG